MVGKNLTRHYYLKKLFLGLVTDIDMLLMVEKSIRGGTHHCIYRYAEANKKCIKNYDLNKESS